jgi:hypothetical protein
MSGARNFATDKELRGNPRDGDTFDDRPVPSRGSGVRGWLGEDWPYIAMLVLALVGVSFHLPAGYWAALTPVFGIICVVAGWPKFETREARLQLIYTQALSWFALILAIFILYSTGVQGVLNVPSTSLAMMTLLGLGTFTAGLQARVWRICAVGGVLFLTVPGIGWVKQSAMLLVFAFLIVVAISGLIWWLGQRRQSDL